VFAQFEQKCRLNFFNFFNHSIWNKQLFSIFFSNCLICTLYHLIWTSFVNCWFFVLDSFIISKHIVFFLRFKLNIQFIESKNIICFKIANHVHMGIEKLNNTFSYKLDFIGIRIYFLYWIISFDIWMFFDQSNTC